MVAKNNIEIEKYVNDNIKNIKTITINNNELTIFFNDKSYMCFSADVAEILIRN